ncbi:UAA transporter [Penicillium taxi]|uniref:UAA transporter n=1 Tax=Penicillium taxi TaxID=168475 RepID=UPI0025452D34|nr:UAA transporter [Penicillium taxi]KAJ5894054.1 UAA transporter [Penicillium taxi]
MNPNNYNPGQGAMQNLKPVMQPKNDTPLIMNHVAQALKSQGTFTGWKADVSIKVRASNVYQMITSLRLIQPRIDLNAAASAALSFEQKAFQKAMELGDYEKECTEKLHHIKDTRQRQAAVAMQSGMIPQAGAQMQGGFMRQMNQGMQSSPIPGQQQQRPTNGVLLPDDLNNLSPQDLDHVSRLANQMVAKTSSEDLEKIKGGLSNMTDEQRSYLQRKNMDPLTYFFRSQALSQLRRHRRSRLQEMGRASNASMDPNAAMMGDPMMNQQRQIFQNMMNLQRNSTFTGNPGQGLDPGAFIGNVENIQGQQADGMRSQEAGQLVVPASSSQMNQPPSFPNQQNMFPQQMNPHIQGGSNVPQDRMQLQAQAQAQAHAQAQAQARAQAAQKAQMAMSGHNGQPTQTHLAQSSPVMPMLNQPMAPAQISPVPAQAMPQGMPQNRLQNVGQRPVGAPGVPQGNMVTRPTLPSNLPPQLHAQLSAMSDQEIQAWMINQQQRRALANNMARANGVHQPGSLQQNASQLGQGQPMFNGQMANNARMRNSISMQQGMNAASQAQAQQLQGQQLTPQQRAQQQQRQNELQKLHTLRQQNNGPEMTPEQSKEMDRALFPPSITVNNINVPKNIKTWGQLKQWAGANPQASNGVEISKLMVMQKLHFVQILAAQARNQNGQGMLSQQFQPQGPGTQAQPSQGPQAQMGNPQNFANGQQPHPNMSTLRPITAHDLALFRTRMGPQNANFSDDQLSEIIRNRQRQALLKQMAGGNMPLGQNQPMIQPQPAQQQVKPQAMPQQQHQMPTDQQSVKMQPGGPAKGTKAAAPVKQPVKKKANEDSVDLRNTANPQQQPQPMAIANPAPARPALSISQEQFAAMTPQQQQQLQEATMRKQQQQLLRTQINRAAAEEAWNKNIPPRIKEVYDEIARSAPQPQVLNLSPEEKAAMTKQLRDSLDVISRFDVLVVHGFAKMQGQEKNVKNLLAMRIQIMRQFKDSPEWVVNDEFSISAEHLSGAIFFIRKIFAMMIRMNQQQRPNQALPTAAAPQNVQAGPPALNATNLQQLQLQQQQEEALQSARHGSSQSGAVPAAAPFGAPSPSGVPHAYGPGGLAPEKLKLPPPKKRKQSQAGASASPVQTSAPPVSAAKSKQAVESTVAAWSGPIKCKVVECQHNYHGFKTQAALDKHVEEKHPPEKEEVIDDPLQYYVDSVNIGLGLTEEADELSHTNKKRTSEEMENDDPWNDCPICLPKLGDTLPTKPNWFYWGINCPNDHPTPDSVDVAAVKTPEDIGNENNENQLLFFEPWDEISIEETIDHIGAPDCLKDPNSTGEACMDVKWDYLQSPQILVQL